MSKRPADGKDVMKRKRLVLSIEEKVNILKKMDEGCSAKVLSDRYHVGLSTIYDIKKQKKDLIQFYSKADDPSLMNSRKTLHQAKTEDVDKVLFEWIKQRRAESFPLTRGIIIAQAKKFHNDLQLESTCEYSDGWFTRFKQRHGLKLLKISGERAAADAESAENYVDYLMDFVHNNNISLEQIFNADETALFYKYIPKHTYTLCEEKSASNAMKDSKQRITLLGCANAAGTCKIKLTVIGKSRRPRALKNIKVLPVNYKANKSAWVTQDLFIDWFETQFVPKARAHCTSVGLPSDCKIFLFLDNCSAHPPPELLKANNVVIEYLPPNCTSLIQPLDQGVLRSLKCKYKTHFLKYLLDAFEENKSMKEILKEFTIKDAIWLAARAWDEVSEDTLKHAWHNLLPLSIFLDSDSDSGENDFDGFKSSKEASLRAELKDYAEKFLQSDVLTVEDIEECFNIENDVPISYQLSDSEIVQMVLHPEENEDSEEDENEASNEEKISNARCIELTKELIRGMEQKSFVDESHIMAVYKIQELFLKQKSNLKQPKIDEMFKKIN